MQQSTNRAHRNGRAKAAAQQSQTTGCARQRRQGGAAVVGPFTAEEAEVLKDIARSVDLETPQELKTVSRDWDILARNYRAAAKIITRTRTHQNWRSIVATKLVWSESPQDAAAGSSQPASPQSAKRTCLIAGRAGNGSSGGAKLVITGEKGKPWAEVDLDAGTFARLQLACRELGLTVPQFVETACLKLADKAGQGGVPTPGATSQNDSTADTSFGQALAELRAAGSAAGALALMNATRIEGSATPDEAVEAWKPFIVPGLGVGAMELAKMMFGRFQTAIESVVLKPDAGNTLKLERATSALAHCVTEQVELICNATGEGFHCAKALKERLDAAVEAVFHAVPRGSALHAAA